MIRRLAPAAALLVLLAAVPARAVDPRTYPYDLTARLLPEGTDEFGLWAARWSRTVAPGLQLTTHLGSLLLLSPSLYAKWNFVDLPSLAVTLDGGVLWVLPALARSGGITQLGLAGQVPLALRATVPLFGNADLSFAWAGEMLGGQVFTDGVGTGGMNVTARFESTFVATDDSGAWIAQLKVPLFYRVGVHLDSLVTTNPFPGITFDSVPAWSLVVGRDLVFALPGKTGASDGHLRLAAGYRNRPGIFLVESIGQLIVFAEFFVR